jgi:polysaccharide biosynthesis/export protein
LHNRTQTATTGAVLILLGVLFFARSAGSQAVPPAESPAQGESMSRSVTTDDYNQRLEQLKHNLATPVAAAQDYRIGPQDLLDISVFEAPELNRVVRVAASGEISLPLLGSVQAANLTPQTLESVLEELLRRTYMKDPHVGVFVREMHSHPVSVFGAVKKPGVFQIDGPKSLVEILSMAEGLAEDAGDTVIVMRGAGRSGAQGPAGDSPTPKATTDGSDVNAHHASDDPSGPTTVETSLKSLLESGDPRSNVMVYPGDIVKVTRAGVVYVEGDVKKPGGFMLKTNENITVLQAVALAEGLAHTAAGNHARIMRTDETTGARREIPIDLNKILAGRVADPVLRPKDIVFVPNSAGKSALFGSAQAIAVLGSAAVYRW